jgi:hypothetical protein
MSSVSTTLPFNPAEAQPSTLSAVYDRLLGKKYTDGNFTYRLVKLSHTSGFDIRKKVLKWVSRADNTVGGCTAITDKTAGIGPASMDVATTADGSYILIICGQGDRPTVTHSDDTTNSIVAARLLAIPDDDADKGKARGVAVLHPGIQPFGRYISGTAADNADIVVELLDLESTLTAALPGNKTVTFRGAAAAGACTATGAAVGDRVIGPFKLADHSDSLVTTLVTTAVEDAVFEKIVTVADQIQQVSESDLSDNRYFCYLAPALV